MEKGILYSIAALQHKTAVQCIRLWLNRAINRPSLRFQLPIYIDRSIRRWLNRAINRPSLRFDFDSHPQYSESHEDIFSFTFLYFHFKILFIILSVNSLSADRLNYVVLFVL